MIHNRHWLAGIIGEKPSAYSISPALWNAAFKKTGIDAAYAPFDVPRKNLKPFLAALRQRKNLLGFNVTVPHKTRIIPLLDSLTPTASSIGAVNTVIRKPDGRLLGDNTDGYGGLLCLTGVLPGQRRSFLKSLSGKTVLLLGAGGAGRAVAFALSDALGPRGRLWIFNRTSRKSSVLARNLKRRNAGALRDRRALANALGKTDLLINATVLGQSGFRKRRSPVTAEELARLKDGARVFDLIYSPAETVFLQQARRAGHATLNGRNMILWQAARSFCAILRSHGFKPDERKILKIMAFAWPNQSQCA